jgi:uncharacterized protein YdiU (UPF0061 family)
MEVAKKSQKKSSVYSKFDQLDGSHPFKKAMPDSFVDYPARVRKGGKLRYFNFELARQMGLIPKDHPDKLNVELEKKILDTFAIIIINEYDQLNNIKFPEKEVKSGTYMATRYLQLQHDDKQGRTSGDGRSVWNGQVRHNGKVWDVSSGGTGGTRLSPATSKFNKFFKSGDPSISYGCGYAEIEEGLASAIFSEIFNRNGIETEQTLVVIQFEKNFSINVRAHQNLLRPSHFFNHLKQGNLESLKSAIDFHIHQEKNKKRWDGCPKDDKKYDFFLEVINETFAKTAAIFESEYIFCWLDWDGDNILMDGGIIDYGSIRQFGLFHAEYRYDDVERFSTTILEQKEKAKYIVQSFIQAVDFIQKGKKRKIGSFTKHALLKKFETIFEEEKNRKLMHKLGFSDKQVEHLLAHHGKTVKDFKKIYYHFERAKSKRGMVKISDGITWDAIFCMRDLLRELPQIYLSRMENITNEEFIEILKSNYADEDDLELTPYRKKMIQQYQKYFWKLLKFVAKDMDIAKEKLLLEMSMRSSIINKMERVTGDSITHIVDLVLKKQPKLSADELYRLFDEFAQAQYFEPHSKKESNTINKQSKHLIRDFFEIVKEHREGI